MRNSIRRNASVFGRQMRGLSSDEVAAMQQWGEAKQGDTLNMALFQLDELPRLVAYRRAVQAQYFTDGPATAVHDPLPIQLRTTDEAWLVGYKNWYSRLLGARYGYPTMPFEFAS